MELHRLGIAGLTRAYAAGETTPSEAIAAALAGIDRLNPRLNAFADLDRAGAARAAAESDQRFRDGSARPLEGVPVGIKSNIAVAGLPWTAGMELRRDVVAGHDAPMVAGLRAAGAIILGTCGMHEAALGATSDNPWFGRIGNPHRGGVSPGGSSGGSGAAVAAGLCVVALGSDTLGSIRIPAAYNGIYGLKPTWGAVDATDVFPLAPGLDTVGPLARSIDDLAALWRVIGGGDPTFAFRQLLLLDAIGEVDVAVRAGYEAALAAIDLPCSTLRFPDPLPAIRLSGFAAMGHALIAELGDARHARSAALSPDLAATLAFCDGVAPDPDLLARTRTALVDALGTDGVLLMPTVPQVAFEHGRAPMTMADFTGFANIAGLPALSIPAGRDGGGLPVAVQIVGPAGSEAALFDLGRDLDAALAGYAPPPARW
ncbi:amidase [Sphingosinicellaceae bacterium]|nr:amidase [Sphingosinicellaceae bacterium]